MPRSYWIAIVALGLAAILIAFGFGSYITTLSYPKQDKGYQPYQSSQHNGQKTPFSVAKAPQSAVHRTPCQYPQTGTESDLCAQWRAAKAAEDSAHWAMWGVLASIVGIILLLWQIILTREAVDDTGKATLAMQDANEITKKSNEIQLRAYIAVIPDGVDMVAKSNNVTGYVKVKNTGIVPARHVNVTVKMFVGTKSDVEILLELFHSESVGRAIHSGDEIRIGSDEIIEVAEIDKEDAFIFVWGMSQYDDGFGNVRFTRFCHRYRGRDVRRKLPVDAVMTDSDPRKFLARRLATEYEDCVVEAKTARHHEKGNDAD